MALLIGKLRSGYSLQELIGSPSALLVEGQEEILESYDKAASHVV
jgi:hypothetical protein